MKLFSHIILVFSILLFLFPLGVFAQPQFKTVVPQHPIVPGESFQVQYIVENADNVSDFLPPQFHGFRVVAGPNIYSGIKSKRYRNLVFTLAAINEGRFKIYGASCLADGRLIKSNEAIVKVIALKESDEPSYFLSPGEDPFKKIRENLFLKLIIDKQNCFIGEPLVATFKLYSRLQSKSDVVKNPGFYGFGVCDMINVNDNVQSEEKLKGHWFDVHTIRKVQLYPLQSGTFTIDPMELDNRIEFSRSIVNKKTEQEVSENMYNHESADDHAANTEVYQMKIKTDPVAIRVNPLPGRNVADTFTGAVGNFSIHAFTKKDTLLKNEESSLIVEINGAGNFQAVSAPVINWPEAVEVFEPSISDTLDKQLVPLTGQRSFKYIFLSNKPGVYTIPAISFTFFNVKTNTYRTISAKRLTIFISAKNKEDKVLFKQISRSGSKNKLTGWLVGSGLFALIVAIFFGLRRKQARAKKVAKQKEKMNETSSRLISIEELLKPAESAPGNDDKIFYTELNHAAWNYFNQRLQLSGSQTNKTDLAKILIEKGIQRGKVDELINLIHQCETGMYTKAEMGVSKKELLYNTKQIMEFIEDVFTQHGAEN